MSVGAVPQTALAPAPGRSARWRWWSSFAALLVGAILFIRTFASPVPTTDEWFFTKEIVAMQRFDLHTQAGIESVLQGAPRRFASHIVTLPYFVYWPIAEWTQFDSRVFMYFTLLTFVVEALLLWRFAYQRSMWAFPVAMLLLGPSHYMEFLWGWQMTLALSIVFPVAGLVLVDRVDPGQRLWKQAAYLLAGLALCCAGVLSSAGGFFGLPCAALLLLLKRARAPLKLAWLSIALLAVVVVYERYMAEAGARMNGGQPIGLLLTALGGTIYGTPVGIFRFGLDVYMVTGIVILACIAIVLRRADAVGALPDLALPVAITAFGILCTLSIALARKALGNWHLQYVLMAVCGAHAAAFRLWRIDRSRFSAVPFFTLSALLFCNVIAWWQGFTRYGPEYREYVQGVEQYCREYLANPSRAKNFPGSIEVNANMLLFLSAHHHPVFQDDRHPRTAVPLPESARVFLNFKEIGPTPSIVVDDHRLARLTVVLPVSLDPHGVLARIGDSDVMLRQIHPSLTDIPCTDDPNVVPFAALIVPRVLGAGEKTLQLSMLR